MEIKHVEKIQGTPVVPFAVGAWKELIDQGLTGNSILIDWEMNAFTAEEGGRIVGAIVYKVYEHDHSLFVALGYVAHEHRGKHIYRALWGKIVEKARERGCLVIDGITHCRNTDMQAVMERFGRQPRYITYEYDVDTET